MCGFLIGKVNYKIDIDNFVYALSTMKRRGPDATGHTSGSNFFIGHNRLSILDLDSRSNQPLDSSCGRYSLVFNGEIYNFKDLKVRLQAKGMKFFTSSDSEVLINLYIYYGSSMLDLLEGMFAFVIFDKLENSFFFARDPYGIKPFYIGRSEEGYVFSSQVKPILKSGIVSSTISSISQFYFLLLGSVPEPHTWYENITALPAGSFGFLSNSMELTITKWCDISEIFHTNEANFVADKISSSKLQSFVTEAVNESFKRHLVSDVPVGLFLSGGIDSGVLAGLFSQYKVKDAVAITLGFDEYNGSKFDEISIAKDVATHFGLKFHNRSVSEEEFKQDLPFIIESMDQPSIDGINTWYASKAASELGLKVAISGVGGDELFHGYRNFHQIPKLLNLNRSISNIPGCNNLLNAVCSLVAFCTNKSKFRFLADWSGDIRSAWFLLRAYNMPNELIDKFGVFFPSNPFDPIHFIDSYVGPLSQNIGVAISQIESSLYLKNQLLRDSDWASMAHSLEIRTPFVDANLLKTLQPFLHYFGSYPNKSLLSSVPLVPLPKMITSRAKSGFSIPINKWVSNLPSNKDNYDWGGFLYKAWSN